MAGDEDVLNTDFMYPIPGGGDEAYSSLPDVGDKEGLIWKGRGCISSVRTRTPGSKEDEEGVREDSVGDWS